MNNIIKNKVCNKCLLEKPILEYHKYDTGQRRNVCNECWQKKLDYENYLKINNLKLCSKCHIEKPISNFRPCETKDRTKYADGMYSYCTSCSYDYFKRYRKYDKEHLEKRAAFREKHRQRIRNKARITNQKKKFCTLANVANTSAKRKSTGERITAQQLWSLAKKQKLICPISGVKLTKENISLDHIVPFYQGGKNTIDNIQLVDFDINQMKNCHMMNDFLNIIKTIYLYNFKDKSS